MAAVRQEKESLTQQLLNTIKHKVVLSQELDAWQVGLRMQEFNKNQNDPLTATHCVCLGAGGHASGDQAAGAAAARRDKQRRRPPTKQVFETEGRRKEGVLLLVFQGQITKEVAIQTDCSGSHLWELSLPDVDTRTWYQQQQIKCLQTYLKIFYIFMYRPLIIPYVLLKITRWCSLFFNGNLKMDVISYFRPHMFYMTSGSMSADMKPTSLHQRFLLS